MDLKTNEFTEIVELERTVTPDEKLRVDHIFVRRLKINKANPAEIFKTEETARFDISWPVKAEIETNAEIKTEEKINVNT